MLDRREFLRAGVLGAGGLAVASLPAVASPAKGRNRFTINYCTVAAGAERPFSVFHISDTHFTATLETDPEAVRRHESGRFLGWNPEDAFASSIDWAKEHGCECVVHTGDLIDCATDGNVALLRRCLAQTGNLLYAPGNHEWATTYAAPREGMTEAEFRAINTAKVQAAAPFDLSFSSKVVNGVNFVMIDDVYGTVAPSIVERFHAEAKKGLPIILGMHVPFYTDSLWITLTKAHSRGLGLSEVIIPEASGNCRLQKTDRVTAEFIRYLKSEPLLKAILAGHHHFGLADRFSPTAMQYVVAANFRYCGEEILIS